MKALCTAVALLVVATLCSLSLAGDEEEPRYKGMTMAEWLAGLESDEAPVRETSAAALTGFGERAVDPLVALLGNAKVTTRAAAALALGKLGPSGWAAAAALAGALADADPTVRTEAAVALGALGTDADPALAALARALNDEHAGVGEAASRSLALLGERHAAAIDALLRVVRDTDRDHRFAARALVRIGSRAVPALLTALRKEANPIRKRVLVILAELGPEARDAFVVLFELQRDDDVEIRELARVALSAVGSSFVKAGPELIEQLHKGEEPVRARAATTLGAVRPTPDGALAALIEALQTERSAPVLIAICDAVLNLQAAGAPAAPALARLLTHENDQVANNAASCLGSIGRLADGVADAAIPLLLHEDPVRYRASVALNTMEEGAVPGLRKALREADRSLKIRVAHFIAQFGAPATSLIPDLLHLLEDPDAGLAKAASDTLVALGSTAVEGLREALKSGTGSVPLLAATILRDMGAKAQAALPELAALLRHDDRALCIAGMLALGRIGPAAARHVKAIQKLLTDDDADLRIAAATALGGIVTKERSAVGALAALLADPELKVRNAAAEALGAIGPEAKSALKALVKVFIVDKPNVRRRVVTALGEIGPRSREVLPTLIRALRDDDVRVRERAAAALARIGPKAKAALKKLEEVAADPREEPSVREAAKEAIRAIAGE